MKIGFTATRFGMSEWQSRKLYEVFTLYRKTFPDLKIEFHHGNCVGGDEEAAIMARSLGLWVVAHPAIIRRSVIATVRSDEYRESKPPLDRNHDIVDESDVMIAAPLTDEETFRSGTWSTVRYAKRQNKRLITINRGES